MSDATDNLHKRLHAEALERLAGPTKALHLILSNNRGGAIFMRAEARRARKDAPECEQVTSGVWELDDAERRLLADYLKDRIGERLESYAGRPIQRAEWQSELRDTLCRSALHLIDWDAVAQWELVKLTEHEDDAMRDADDSG